MNKKELKTGYMDVYRHAGQENFICGLQVTHVCCVEYVAHIQICSGLQGLGKAREAPAFNSD
jgi:hypothetical protein